MDPTEFNRIGLNKMGIIIPTEFNRIGLNRII